MSRPVSSDNEPNEILSRSAQDLQAEALRLRRRLLGDQHPLTLLAVARLAVAIHSGGDATTAIDLIEQAASGLERAIGESHPTTLGVVGKLAEMFNGMGAFARARELQEGLVRILEQQYGHDDPNTLHALQHLASTIAAIGDLHGASTLQDRVTIAYSQQLPDEDGRTLHAMAASAHLYSELGQKEQASELQNRTIAALRRLRGREELAALSVASHLADRLDRQGDLLLARELQEQAVAGFRSLLGDDEPTTLAASLKLGVTLQNLGEFAAAKELKTQVLSAYHALAGASEAARLSAMTSLGVTLRDSGDLDQALRLQRQAVHGLARLRGYQDPTTLNALVNLGETLRTGHQMTEALEVQERAVAGLTATFGRESEETLRAAADLGRTHHELGNFRRARELLEQATRRLTVLLGREHYVTVMSAVYLGKALHSLGLFEQARDIQSHAVRVLRERGTSNPDTADAMGDLASTLRKLGDVDAAEALHRELTPSNLVSRPLEPRSPQPAIHQLPSRYAGFRGRRTIMDSLPDLLSNGIAAVVGSRPSGGTGASAIALEYAHRHMEQYDLIWWIPAHNHNSVVRSLANLALRLGFADRPRSSEAAQWVLSHLADRDGWLLVFDGADHPEHFDDYIPRGAQGHVLITSRNGVWRTLVNHVSVDGLAMEEALELLGQRIGEQDSQTALSLTQELESLPMAIEIAAAYVQEGQVPLEQVLEFVRNERKALSSLYSSDTFAIPIAAVVRLGCRAVADVSTEAAMILRLSAYLADEPFPPRLIAAELDALPLELRLVASDTEVLASALVTLQRYGLLHRAASGVKVHRVTQDAIRASMNVFERITWCKVAVRLLSTAAHDAKDERKPFALRQLMPHYLTASDYASQLNVEPFRNVYMLELAAEYAHRTAEFELAYDLLARAVDTAEATYGGDRPELSTALNDFGNVLNDLGYHAAARTALERALAIREAAFGPASKAVALTLANLASALQRTADLGGAHDALQRARSILHDVEPTGLRMAHVLNNLGTVLSGMGKAGSARDALSEALEIRERLLDLRDPRVATTVNNLATVCETLGDLKGARIMYERALKIAEEQLGPDHPDVAVPLNNLGVLLQRMGDLPESLINLERAAAIMSARFGSDHPRVASIISNLSVTLRELGGPTERDTQLSKVEDIAQKTPDTDKSAASGPARSARPPAE